jgi:magnesium-transporting ATPase (P-type)
MAEKKNRWQKRKSFFRKNGFRNTSTVVGKFCHFIIVGIALVVVSVPEGIPLAVMIALAYSVYKMLEE